MASKVVYCVLRFTFLRTPLHVSRISSRACAAAQVFSFFFFAAGKRMLFKISR